MLAQDPTHGAAGAPRVPATMIVHKVLRACLPLAVLAALALVSTAVGLTRVAPPDSADADSGDGWWPHRQAQAAILFVADPRSDARLLKQSITLLRELGFSVMIINPAARAVAPARALVKVELAWSDLRRRQPGLPLVMAGHGFGATLASVLASELEPASRPQLLWLLAPGRPAPWTLSERSSVPADLLRPEAALARVDALCIGQIQRATRLLLVHGSRDDLVSPLRTKALDDAAPEATVYRVKGAGHHDLLEAAESRSVLKRLLGGWLRAVRAARAGNGRRAAPDAPG